MVIAIGAAVVSTVALVAIARRRSNKRSSSYSADDVQRYVPVIRELARRFFESCREVADFCKQIRKKLETQGMAFDDEQLRAQLLAQCQVMKAFKAIQEEVVKAYDMTEEEVMSAQEHLAKVDKEVAELAEGFQTMLNDALGGVMPMMPGVVVPTALNEEKVLEIHAQVQADELKKVVNQMREMTGEMKPQELAQSLNLANRSAEEEMLKSKADLLGGGAEVYHTAMALYSRNPDFMKEKGKLDEKHRQKLLKMFKLQDNSSPTANGSAAAATNGK